MRSNPKPDTSFARTLAATGCEDARVTYVAALDLYLMAYCAYGPGGTKVAVAYPHADFGAVKVGAGHAVSRSPSPSSTPSVPTR
ncbi:MAG: hypothetical protein GIX03_15705 [Candidatus Eremiobacteraeota bacterium]|nr:hypothetical protein [Candidatus Eremiobacteraeota bacterium]MBC5804410.1 hypothetical protein [Candidatus Eremiobacteraeota bacterium]MBC5821365.1 hypothetical protein [Candidatus Eremiobacteraeota bacterium]